MDPKRLVVLGMGGFMMFFFFIVGIIYWVTMDEEEETVEDNTNNNDDDSSTTTEESGCKTGEVMHLNECKPICDEYGGGERYMYWAPVTGKCFTADAALSNHDSDKVEETRVNQRDNCNKRFTKDTESSTGYSICQKTHQNDRCGTYDIKRGSTEEIKRIECVPKKLESRSDQKKIPICGKNVWVAGQHPGLNVGTSTWEGQKTVSDVCDCPLGTNATEKHDGHGNSVAKDTWRCL